MSDWWRPLQPGGEARAGVHELFSPAQQPAAMALARPAALAQHLSTAPADLPPPHPPAQVAPVKLGSLLAAGPLRQVAGDVRAAPASLVSTDGSEAPATPAVVEALRARGCAVVTVGDDAAQQGADSVMPRDAYLAELAAPAAEGSVRGGRGGGREGAVQ